MIPAMAMAIAQVQEIRAALEMMILKDLVPMIPMIPGIAMVIARDRVSQAALEMMTLKKLVLAIPLIPEIAAARTPLGVMPTTMTVVTFRMATKMVKIVATTTLSTIRMVHLLGEAVVVEKVNLPRC
jgi:hypothetical protein